MFPKTDVPTPPLPAYTPTRADSTVLQAGLAGLRPSTRPELSSSYALSKRTTSKRTLIGGA